MPGRTTRSSASPSAARSPTVFTPAAARRCSAFGPTPGSARTGNGARKRASLPGGTTVIPPGLRRSEATLQTTFEVETPREHESEVAARTDVCTASATARAPGTQGQPCRGRGSPRRSRPARRAARPRGSRPRRPRSTAGRGHVAGGRTRRRGTGGAPRPSSSPSGCRTAGRRSWPSRRRHGPAGCRRRRAAACGARDPPAPRLRQRRHRGRDGRESALCESYGAAVITAPPPPPAIEQPAPYQLSYGVVSGTRLRDKARDRAGRGAEPGRQAAPPAAFPAPRRAATGGDDGARSSRSSPRPAESRDRPARPRRVRAPPRRPRARRARRAAPARGRRACAAFGGTSAVYVENLATGAGAAWNARATFPAASTLKLAIAVTALARSRGNARARLDARPALAPDADVFRQRCREQHRGLLRRLDLRRLGSRELDDAVVGLVDTEMYGGYELDALGGPPRLLGGGSRSASTASLAGVEEKVDARTTWRAFCAPCGSRAAAMARCARRSPDSRAADGRYLLYLLAHVRDPGKIDREVGRLAGVRVLHKAGWITSRGTTTASSSGAGARSSSR